MSSCPSIFRFLTFLLFFVLHLPLHSLAAGIGPRLACRQAEHLFGVVENHKSIEHVFTLANDGDAALQIGNVRACCGATASIAINSIAPGSNTTLKVVLSLQGRNGEQRKSFYVASNDPKQPYYQLRLVGTAVAALDVQPRSVDFGLVDDNTTTNTEVVIHGGPHVLFRITNTVWDAVGFSAECRPGASQDVWRVRIGAVPPLPIGVTRATLTLFTDHAQYSKIDIPAVVTIASDIVVVPREILITEGGQKAAPVTRYVALRSRKGKPFRILAVVPPEPEIKVKQEPLPAGGHRITLENVMPFEDLSGKDLVITTDHEQVKKVAIPFKVVTLPQ
jgi:hypothetical protein